MWFKKSVKWQYPFLLGGKLQRWLIDFSSLCVWKRHAQMLDTDSCSLVKWLKCCFQLCFVLPWLLVSKNTNFYFYHFTVYELIYAPPKKPVSYCWISACFFLFCKYFGYFTLFLFILYPQSRTFSFHCF